MLNGILGMDIDIRFCAMNDNLASAINRSVPLKLIYADKLTCPRWPNKHLKTIRNKKQGCLKTSSGLVVHMVV